MAKMPKFMIIEFFEDDDKHYRYCLKYSICILFKYSPRAKFYIINFINKT